jgi:predicted aspartyl protease
MKRSTVSALVAMASAELVLLASCRPAATESALEIPFRFEHHQVLIEVELNGEGPFTMLIDTAGDPSAVDLATAREVGLPVDTTRVGEASGVGGQRVSIYPASLTRLVLGGRDFGDEEALALDLSSLSERLGEPLHGILGYGFLKDRITQIDYAAGTVRFFDTTAEARSFSQARGAEALVLPLELRPGDIAPWFDVHLNGGAVRVTLDTGSSLGLELYPVAAERLGLQELREQAEVGSVVGARGASAIATTTADSLRVGSHTIRDPELVFSDRDDQGPREGNLGNRILRHFVLTLDYVADTLRFAVPTDS